MSRMTCVRPPAASIGDECRINTRLISASAAVKLPRLILRWIGKVDCDYGRR